MKKIYFFLVMALSMGQVLKAQTSVPEVFNFTELAAYDAAHPGARNLGEENEFNVRNRHSFPLPPGANIKYQNIPNVSNSSTPASASPSPAQSFGSYVDPVFSIPPDTHGCAGPNHVVTYTNDWIIVQNKLGGAIVSQINALTFEGVTNAAGDTYIRFDPVSNRYIATAFTAPPSGPNKIVICVSQTSNPTGLWYRYFIQPTVTNANVFWDHPFLGFDGRFVVVSGRQFNNNGPGFYGTGLLVVDKAAMIAGLPVTNGVNSQTLEGLGAAGLDSPCPVSVYGVNPSTDFNILQSVNGTSIRLTKVTGNLPNLVWNIAGAVFPSVTAGNAWQDFAQGAYAQQAGEARKIQAINEISSAQMINGNIWCVHNIGLPATGAVTSLAVQWWQLTPTGTILQRGRVGGAPGEYRWFPSIAVNASEAMVIGYTQSTSSTTVSAAYSTRSCSTAPNTTDDEFIFKTGLAVYWKDYGGGRCRWGDYSSTSLDPIDGTLWTIQEYAAARVGTGDNASRYGLWWAQVDPCPTIRRDASVSAILEPRPIVYCNFPINPKVTIRNNGLDTLTSVSVGEILDITNIGTQAFTNLNILPGQSITVTLAGTINSATSGNHTFKAYTFLPNGLADQRPSNDTSSVTFNVLQTLPLPNLEGFENATFPPPGGWAIDNPDGAATWRRTTANKLTGLASMTLSAYNYTARGQIDRFKSPKLDISNLDSVKISFDLSYAPYNAAGFVDTLIVEYSLDCGQTWIPTSYKKWASLTPIPNNLGTAPPQAGAWSPTLPSQWRNEKINLPICGITSPSMMIGITWVNQYGNNVFIDNLNIVGVNTVQRNAAALGILAPFGTVCTSTFTPSVMIGNFGSDVLTSATVSYSIDGGPATPYSFTGSLAKCSTQVVTLPAATTTPGPHIFTVYTSQPNGGTDQYTFNDTISTSFIVSKIVTAPLVEGFENPLFPPDGWNVLNPDGLVTWERTTLAGSKSAASMVIRNFDYPVANTVDKFYSPVVTNNSTIDSFYVSFDYAYSPGFQYPGATVFPLDTLDLQITQDCGKTFTSVWKKWGPDLSTLLDPLTANNPNNTAYVPQKPYDWKSAKIYLSPTIGTQNFQVYFVAKSNKQNNLYIDNINISSKTVPAKVKSQGYLIYPSPFTSSFKIHHYLPPVDLQSIGVYNSVGQLVWRKDLNGQGNTEEFINLQNMAAGVYEVKLNFSNKTIVERVVKLQ